MIGAPFRSRTRRWITTPGRRLTAFARERLHRPCGHKMDRMRDVVSAWMYVVDIDRYLYLVPFVTAADGTRFLKTIIPSRKATRDYGRRRPP